MNHLSLSLLCANQEDGVSVNDVDTTVEWTPPDDKVQSCEAAACSSKAGKGGLVLEPVSSGHDAAGQLRDVSLLSPINLRALQAPGTPNTCASRSANRSTLALHINRRASTSPRQNS